MSSEAPLNNAMVSVVIPARNAESTIKQSLESCLQSAWVGEVIVINDGSIDGTVHEVSKLQDERVRIITGPSRGISAALNTGFAACRFPFVARCDADDWIEPNRFEWQLREMDDPSVVAVSGAFRTADSRGREIAYLAGDGARRDVTAALQTGTPHTHLCTWLIRRQAVEDCGGAREWFQTAEDIDLQFRLAALGRVIHVPRPAYRYRLHDQSITHTQGSVQRDFFEQTAKDFARQRKETGSDQLERGNPPEVPSEESAPNSAGKNIAGQLVGRAWQYHRQGQRWPAIKTMLRAARHNPVAGPSLIRQSLIMLVRRPARPTKEQTTHDSLESAD